MRGCIGSAQTRSVELKSRRPIRNQCLGLHWLARLFGKSEGSKEFEPFKHDDGEHVTCRGSSEPNASFHERAASAASGP